ncbi:polysaccharide biosynthesis/export family protein [uncultured Paracoccus sp.]|uniref:polysaccharide biosynthesis/export family protein n=1 Tax=uncultured Paracoccus sp. TaxID=189685 RepID=UPI002601FFC6|nr:polysaccharide biosynthesis/export family protein [uncultured Paracoccus sp.]
MTNMRRHGRRIWVARGRHLATVLAFTVLAATQLVASEIPLVPHARISITAAQWVEAEGAFRHWPELEGDFTIGADGTIRLPMVGAVTAAGQTAPEVAAEIATSFARKVGLNAAPDVVVTVAEYPPIFLVGDVTSPGQYAFTPGLTVLKALALGGGTYRPGNRAIQDQVALVGEQEDLSTRILRAEARIARLAAEQRGAESIVFPPVLSSTDAGPLAHEIIAAETVLFEARANGIRRQRAALDELTQLLGVEIDVLVEKAAMVDAAIASADEELQGVRRFEGLPAQGLEASLSNLRAQRLDQTTAITRARQGLAATERDHIALDEERQATVTAELQDARADLDRLRILLDVSQRKLLLTQSEFGAGDMGELQFSIIRIGGPEETISASEATSLLPGDTLKVETPGSTQLSRREPDLAAERPTQLSTLAESD